MPIPILIDMKMAKIQKLTCQRCGHAWVPRKRITYVCPKCNNARWDIPKPKHQEGG